MSRLTLNILINNAAATELRRLEANKQQLLMALKASQSWLSSYAGGGAMKRWEQNNELLKDQHEGLE